MEKHASVTTYCAWCKAEGTETMVHEGDVLPGERHYGAICLAHKRQQMERWQREQANDQRGAERCD